MTSLTVAYKAISLPTIAELCFRQLTDDVLGILNVHLRIVTKRQNSVLDGLLFCLVPDDFMTYFTHRATHDHLFNHSLCGQLLVVAIGTGHSFKLGNTAL